MLDVITSTATIVNPALTDSVHNLLYSILQLSVIGLVSGMTWAVKLWINSMKSGWKQTIARRLVKFAAQKIEGNGDRARYVAAKIHEKFPRLGQEEVAHLLEEAVSDFKMESLAPSVVVETAAPPQGHNFPL